ncbi:MAG TPA: DNA helicase RecQ [Anaerolineales bacterium]
MSSQPEKILQTVFGYPQFKPLQAEVIANVLSKKDTLGIMPTGGGKSLCYQIPALIFSGLTVVVSPLISLMKDQVEQLAALGVPALFLNSSLSSDEYRENMARVRSKQVKLLYVAPETLLTPRLLGLLSSVQLDCLTIDEAHCISEWGHDFRPEYRQLVAVREQFPQAVCLALTATATRRVRQDIQDSLHFESSNEFIASFNRENLWIEVTPKTEPARQTLEFIQRFPEQSGIVYCFSRKQVDDLAAFLHKKGYSVRPYHAGLADEERRQNQELFIRDDVQIIVATIAFGMGINKPNVRFILHHDLPKSIESYYQEIGRAGRDGLIAHCRLLYSYSDVQKLRYFIDQKEEAERQVAYQHLNALVRFAESDVCRRAPLMAYFGETYNADNCGNCDNCRSAEKMQVDISIPALKFLSCVKRTGELFGASHIAGVLLGEDNAKVHKFGHQSLSTFGIGKELTKKQWLHLGRQLAQKGFLQQEDRYGSLKLTPKAYELFKNQAPVWGVLLEEAVGPESKIAAQEYDLGLFEVLKRKRKELADAAHVPPYVIFSDKTLVEMAAYYPLSLDSLMKMHGVGAVKLERFGAVFLELIKAYCREHGTSERPKPRARKAARASGPEAEATQLDLKPRYVEVAEAYNDGQPVQALMEAYRVQQGTILDHLARYVQEGNTLRPDEGLLALTSLPAEQQSAALAAFDELGAMYLKPVFDQLNGAISYEDLKIMRLYYLGRA